MELDVEGVDKVETHTPVRRYSDNPDAVDVRRIVGRVVRRRDILHRRGTGQRPTAAAGPPHLGEVEAESASDGRVGV